MNKFKVALGALAASVAAGLGLTIWKLLDLVYMFVFIWMFTMLINLVDKHFAAWSSWAIALTIAVLLLTFISTMGLINQRHKKE